MMKNFEFQVQETSNYSKKIINLINQLNSLADSQVQNRTQQLLNELKRIDQLFMKHHKIQWKGHIVFTRHGQCKNWSEKTFGMNPNAALAQQAVAGMKKTHKYTKEIIFYPEQIPIVRISPLIRAKQTAKLLLPQNRSYNIKIEICLTENSGYPSGTFIRSKQELRQQSQKASFFTNPTRALTYTIAELIYSKQSIFNKIEQVSSQIDKNLVNLCKQENKSELLMSLSEKKEQLQKMEKVRCIKQIIEQNLQFRVCDIWFFGHNNNIKTFFNSLFGRNTSLEYGEIRRIYKIQWNTHQFYLHPSYNFVVDQSNGRVRAKFTPEQLKTTNFKNTQ